MTARLSCIALVVFASMFASAASAKSVSFDVRNNTGHTLTGIYAGPSSQDEWGDNILAGKAATGTSVTITIVHGGQCKFDLRYDFADADSYEEYAIDICAIDGKEYVIE